MEDVVAPSAPPEMKGDGEAEADGRKEGASLFRVDASRSREGDELDAVESRRLAVPVPHGQVRDLVISGRELQREVAHEPLGATDRLRKDVVVDEADPH